MLARRPVRDRVGERVHVPVRRLQSFRHGPRGLRRRFRHVVSPFGARGPTAASRTPTTWPGSRAGARGKARAVARQLRRRAHRRRDERHPQLDARDRLHHAKATSRGCSATRCSARQGVPVRAPAGQQRSFVGARGALRSTLNTPDADADFAPGRGDDSGAPAADAGDGPEGVAVALPRGGSRCSPSATRSLRRRSSAGPRRSVPRRAGGRWSGAGATVSATPRDGGTPLRRSPRYVYCCVRPARCRGWRAFDPARYRRIARATCND